MAEMAAAYAFGIVKNHPFLDGNKRTGFMMCAGFLERNDFHFAATEVDATVKTLALAAGEMTKPTTPRGCAQTARVLDFVRHLKLNF